MSYGHRRRHPAVESRCEGRKLIGVYKERKGRWGRAAKKG